ncbi:hypothetical protein C8J57DRAFT_1267076 [Mycena rebaudengoi]|nr:hypothetical protein C8J57DRAFT_1267076 [Mycena rebaudengoi]
MSVFGDKIHPDLFELLRKYSSLIPPKHLRFPSNLRAVTVHDFLINHVLLSAHFQAYPPSNQQQKAFWKWAIPHLEKQLEAEPELEINSSIYEHYLALLASDSSSFSLGGSDSLTGQSPPSQSYITHFWRPKYNDEPSDQVDVRSYQTTTLLESRTMVESGTTGLRTWLASLILAQYLILNPGLVHRQKVLELGSGVGFLGSVVASLQLLSQSKNLSSSHPDVRCCFLDWSAALDLDGIVTLTSLLNDEIDADIILGADIVFDPDLIPALVAVLRLALQPRPNESSTRKCAIIALTVRNPTTMQTFLDNVRESDLTLDTIDFHIQDNMFMEPVEGSDANNGVNIFRIARS